MSERSLRIVVDTNVVASSLRSRRGASFRLIYGLDKAAYVPCVSTATFLEYEEVLLRTVGEHGFTPEEVRGFLDYMASVSAHVPIHFRWRPFLADPGDECFLELAVAAGAEVLVTYNKRDFRGVPEQFGVAVLDPREFLERTGELG